MSAPTREQVEQWARESGDDVEHTLPSDIDFLNRFAALAYAAGLKDGNTLTLMAQNTAVAAEREECAKVCEELKGIAETMRGEDAAAEFAEAIRARGQQ